MKRKILPLFLALTMTVSLFTVGASAAEPIYRDTDGHWAAETIEGFSRLGLIEGYNGQFFPNKNITRGEMAVVLDRLMDYQTAAKNSFSDLGEAFYTDAVLKANAAGVMLGSNGTVRPTDPITRQEAAVLLCRALGLEGGGSVAQFSDRGQIASWAADAVGVMAAKKLLQGANGMFRPADAITRAETVAILDRALGKLVSEGESATGKVDGTVVVRGAGAKLSDMTINGDLIIAEGVGVGEVHLDGVTITGRTIVRGGGEHSIYMNNVRANGGVVVNKLDGKVRVVTSGNTTVSVTLLQSGAILVGDGFKTVEIPADVAKGQTVELQGNIERLVNSSEDAKITANGTIQTVEANVKTEIKGDVKVVGATGSADVKVNGSAVAKTDKPAAGGNSGGSSSGGGSSTGGGNSGSGGNSSTASKEITGAEVVTLDVPYGTSADDALAKLPTTVTLNLKGGSTITATVTNWKWDKNTAYTPKPSQPDSTPAVATVTIPSGYTYNGTLTATAKVTVLPLNKEKLIAAIENANAVWSQKLTDLEEEAAKDKTKILFTDKAADAVTEGVQFTTSAAKDALTTAISKAPAINTDFASQKACDDAATALQKAITTFNGTIQTGTNKTTDTYILQQVDEMLSKWDQAAYSPKHKSLKSGSAYPLFIGAWTINDDVTVDIQWKAAGEGAQYVTKIEDSNDTLGYYELNGIRNVVTRGVLIGSATPKQPTEVVFTATVKNAQTNAEIGTLDYSATIGAPIRASLQTDAPQFTAISDDTSATSATNFTGTVRINLEGAVAIKSVSNGCVSMNDANTETESNKVSFNSIRVDKVEKSGDVLNVTVSVTTGAIGGVWNENSLVPAFSKGILPQITIDMSKFQLEENTFGWYLPDTLKLGDMTVDVLTPAFTGVDHVDNKATGDQTFTIHTQNMPENAKVEVALAKKDVGAAGIEQAKIKKDATRGNDGKYSVTFDKNAFESGAEYYLWFRYGSDGSDWAYENVSLRPTYTPNPTTSGGGEGGNTTEGSQAGA